MPHINACGFGVRAACWGHKASVAIRGQGGLDRQSTGTHAVCRIFFRACGRASGKPPTSSASPFSPPIWAGCSSMWARFSAAVGGFSKHLWWELVAAVAIGMIADGMAHQLGLTGPPRTAAIVTIAYLGPRGLEELIVRLIATRRGG
ncbi:phage holin family protein [Tistrella bauzanensis]